MGREVQGGKYGEEVPEVKSGEGWLLSPCSSVTFA